MFEFDYPKVKHSLARTALKILILPYISIHEELYVARISWLSGYGMCFNSLSQLHPPLYLEEVFLAFIRIAFSAFPLN